MKDIFICVKSRTLYFAKTLAKTTENALNMFA